jgi:ribonuclease G
MSTQSSKRGILISMTPYEKRIAIMEDGELVELVVEGVTSNRVLGNIYKGVVQKVLPALKAAFIDIGLEKAGFLHQDDAVDRNLSLRREFGDGDDDDSADEAVSIDELLKEGQEIMVQVIKEPISTKGARLTTHLSFAGRFLVCMPGTNFVGVSKRERDPHKRREFKKVVRHLKGRDVGYIVRTNGLGESELEISKQMRDLESKWELTKLNFENQAAETCIYEESDSVDQTIREYFSDNTDYVYVDSREEYFAIREELQKLSSDKLDKVKLWSSAESLFEYFKIEDDYARSLQRQVPLSRGGNLVIDQTEALVAIDINTGPKVHGKDQAKIILETNIDACYEIAKQLRLRDVGGLIVIDFIDMDTDADRDIVYQEFRKAIRRDKAPISPTPISQFGLMEVTRKRVRANLMTEKTEKCPVCEGCGHILTLETTLSLIDRWLARARTKGRLHRVQMVVSPPMVDVLCRDMGRMFNYLEYKHDIQIELVEDEHSYINQFSMYDLKGEEITDTFNFS